MQNNRLIQMNQWGSFIYIGKHKKGIYKNWGDYAEDLNTFAIEEIMKKLYYFEENFEDLIEKINVVGNINPISANELKEIINNAK